LQASDEFQQTYRAATSEIILTTNFVRHNKNKIPSGGRK